MARILRAPEDSSEKNNGELKKDSRFEEKNESFDENSIRPHVHPAHTAGDRTIYY